MKIDVRALGFSLALLWGGGILVTGIANLIWPTYGIEFLEMLASVYPGYQGTASFGQVLVGTLYGVLDLDGLVGGLVLGWLYNLFSR